MTSLTSNLEDNQDNIRDLARVAYADMLFDQERNDRYEEAIVKTVKFLQKKLGRPVKVVDIGTGTGLLSMMAARAGNSGSDVSHVSSSVTAYDSFPAIAECARTIVEVNELSKQITVVTARGECGKVSSDEDRADLLITELFDTELIGEGAILIYKTVLKNLCVEKPLAVPFKARIWVQVVDSPFLTNHNSFKLLTVHIPKWNSLVQLCPPEAIATCHGCIHLHDLQMNRLRPEVDFVEVSEPIVAFEFIFTDPKTLKDKDTVELTFTPKTVGWTRNSNTCLLFWWDLLMDYEEKIILSMESKYPKDGIEDLRTPWREHWIQAVYYFPSITNDGVGTNGNECNSDIPSIASFSFSHDDYSFHASWESKSSCSGCSCGHHSGISRSRLSTLNNSLYWRSLMEFLVERELDDLNTVYIGDVSMFPLVLAKQNEHSNIHCLTKSKSSTNFFLDYARENNLKNLSVGKEIPSWVSKDCCVVTEPYSTSGDLPTDHLKVIFYHYSQLSFIPATNILLNNIIIKVLPVQFNHLWKTRARIGRPVNGFNIQPFDNVIQEAIKKADSSMESYPLWEYPCRSLCPFPTTLFNREWGRNFPRKGEILETGVTITIDKNHLDSSLKHIALVFWCENCHFGDLISSTGPTVRVPSGEYLSWRRDCRQGVYWVMEEDFFNGNRDKITISASLAMESFNMKVVDMSM